MESPLALYRRYRPETFAEARSILEDNSSVDNAFMGYVVSHSGNLLRRNGASGNTLNAVLVSGRDNPNLPNTSIGRLPNRRHVQRDHIWGVNHCMSRF